jgi:hypothetical protein
MLKLWIEASFSASITWTVSHDDHKGLYYGVRVKKDNSLKCKLDSEKTKSLLQDLKQIMINPFLPDGAVMGCDGACYGLQTGDIFAGAKMEWWSVSPPEWEELTTWHQKMIGFLHSSLPDKYRREYSSY